MARRGRLAECNAIALPGKVRPGAAEIALEGGERNRIGSRWQAADDRTTRRHRQNGRSRAPDPALYEVKNVLEDIRAEQKIAPAAAAVV